MIIEALKILSEGKDINYDITKNVMYEITEGKTTDVQISSFLTALKIKGETIDEITACAEVMRDKCEKTDLETKDVLDIVGTGGDGANTFNISTATTFVVSSLGVPVAKHGNRAFTSKSGAIDVLEALGINTDKTPDIEKEIFKKTNLCFMQARNHHPAMKYASKVRSELKFRTIFNLLGPLTNPAGVNYQLFGVYDEKLNQKLARVILNLGVKNVLVVHGEDGLDEVTICGKTFISEGRDGIIKNYSISPNDFGLKTYDISEIKGGEPDENAKIIRNIFNKKEQGAKRDIVILNSALALYTFNKVSNIKDGIELATNAINSGLVLNKLNEYIEISK